MREVRKYDRPGEWEVVIAYDKRGVEKEWVGVVDGRGGGEYRLSVTAEHTARDAKGRVVVRAVADRGARVTLTGMIKIHKAAQGTDNFLELRVLLLDDKSVATVDPQLEIEANEVKAGHAASVSRLDEQEVEYLMSRGIARERAKEEIVAGWLEG